MQPACGDAGGAMGAALLAFNNYQEVKTKDSDANSVFQSDFEEFCMTTHDQDLFFLGFAGIRLP